MGLGDKHFYLHAYMFNELTIWESLFSVWQLSKHVKSAYSKTSKPFRPEIGSEIIRCW